MSMMDFSGVDFTGLAGIDFSKMDLRDPQGRYPMDEGYNPLEPAKPEVPAKPVPAAPVEKTYSEDSRMTI